MAAVWQILRQNRFNWGNPSWKVGVPLRSRPFRCDLRLHKSCGVSQEGLRIQNAEAASPGFGSPFFLPFFLFFFPLPSLKRHVDCCVWKQLQRGHWMEPTKLAALPLLSISALQTKMLNSLMASHHQPHTTVQVVAELCACVARRRSTQADNSASTWEQNGVPTWLRGS